MGMGMGTPMMGGVRGYGYGPGNLFHLDALKESSRR